MITGEKGSGKTSLAREFHTSVTKLNGYYIEGVGLSTERATPYYVIIDALDNLVHQLLIEGVDSLNKWRSEIKTIVGENGQV